MELPKIPKSVNYILNKIRESNFEAYIVGGCVRDSIMGIPPNDWDITTSAKPLEIKAIFDHTYDTGIKHGTVTVLINKEAFEVTTFRIDGEYTDSRHPENVAYTDNLKEDLIRRDFTMNAIAYNEKTGYIDPFNGIEDINLKIIRGVGEPSKRFNEDALRMLRAVRFSTKLGFTIEKETFNAIIKNSSLIKNISRERIRDEIFKLILGDYTKNIYSLWTSGLMENIHRGIYLDSLNKKDIIINSIKNSPKIIAVRLALMIIYSNIAEIKGFLDSLRLDNRLYTEILNTINCINIENTKDKYIIRGLLNRFGKTPLENSIYIKEALGYNMENFRSSLLEIINNKDCIAIRELNINGNDLKNLGVINGKQIGEILNKLLDRVHKEPSLNKRALLIKEVYNILK